MSPIEPSAATAATKKPPVTAPEGQTVGGDKPVAPPSDATTTAGKLSGSVEMMNPPDNVTSLPPGKVNELAKNANKGINSEYQVAPDKNNPANLPAGAAKVTLSSDVEAKRLEAQNRAKSTAANGDNTNAPAKDAAPLTTAQKLQAAADNAEAARLGKPPTGASEAQIKAAADASAARAGNLPSGASEAQIKAASDAKAAREGTLPAGASDAQVKAAADAKAAREGTLPAGASDAQIKAASDAKAAREGTLPSGASDAQIKAAADAKAARAGTLPPGASDAQIKAGADAKAAREGTLPSGASDAQIKAAADAKAARAGTLPSGASDAQIKAGADARAAREGTLPSGASDAQIKAAADARAARAGTLPSGASEAQIKAATDAANARGGKPPAGASEAQINAAADASAARAALHKPPAGPNETQIKAAADATDARAGKPPAGANDAQIKAAADASNARAAKHPAQEIANNPPGNPPRENGRDRPGKQTEQPALDTSGKPRPGTEVVKPADTPRKQTTDTSQPLTPQEKREARQQARADLVAAREAKRDAPPVVKGDAPPATPAQTRAEVIAAKRAERLAANADPAADTNKGRPKVADPAVTAPDTTAKPRPRMEVPATPADPTIKPARPGTPVVDAGDPNPKRPGRQPLADTGEPQVRPNRRVPDLAVDGDGKPVRPDRPLRPGDSGDLPKGKPLVPQTGDQPPLVARRGDRGGDASQLPQSDLLSARTRKAAGDAVPTAPLDPRQQKFLAEITKGNDPKSLTFRENFEKLSPQNRNALMNMDGKQQIDMIAKLSRPIDGGLDAGKLPMAGDLAKLAGRQDLKIPGLDVADPANRKFLTDVSTRLNQAKADGVPGTMRVSELLKGMDPQKVTALEKFLTTNSSLDAGKVTLGQLDGTKLTQLMKGNFDGMLVTGKTLTPQEAMTNLTRQFTTGDGTNTLNTLGRTLNDMGTQPGRLSELVAKTLDARSPGSAGTGLDLNMMTPGRIGDFTARLNPIQELNIRNMIENSSKLGFDSAMPRFDVSGRGDMIGQAIGLGQIIGTTFGDRGGDFAVRGERIRPQAEFINAADAAEASGGKSQEYIAKLPIDATSGLPYDPSTGKLLDPMTGRPIGDRVSEEKKSQKQRDDEDEMDEKEKKKQKKDADQDAEKAKQKAMLLILQAKKKREQELREKQLKEEKQKKEDETRIKYICKDGDTIQSVALKQLRDSRVAPLIYQINKQVIATTIVNGEQVPLLHAGLVIWLPSPKEIKEFRSKLVGSSGASVQPAEKFASAEDELAARFGAGWAAGKTQDNGGQQQPAQPMSEMERKLMEDAMAEAKRRRENIEKALGPITGGTTRSAKADGEHLSYQVRLGDTLRSVATKHPSIGDVNLWRLLAEVNNLSTDVDAKGQPKAGLARGAKIKIPTATEIAEYRQKVGGLPIVREQRVAKNCPKCGRMTVQSASLCPCGHEFGIDRTPAASNKDAGTIVLEAITETPEGIRTSRTENIDADSAHTTRVGPNTHDASKPAESRESQEQTKETAYVVEPELTWATAKDFEPTCRLTKSAQSWDAADGKLIIHLQLRNDENSEWFPILEYEVYGSYSIRHTFVRQTRAKKTVKIDLPAAAAMELAQNDLLANWNNYKTKYMLA